jgi:hypothetical protein
MNGVGAPVQWPVMGIVKTHQKRQSRLRIPVNGLMPP